MKSRRLAVALHRYIGVTVGILIAIVSLTGGLLVFWKEINSALNPQMFHVVPQIDRISVQSIVEIVRSTYPNWQLDYIELPRTLDSVYIVKMLLNNGDFTYIYLNPYTRNILGSQQWGQTVMSFIYNIHVSLLSGKNGETIVGICGLLLLLLSGTGISLWQGWRRRSIGFKICWHSAALRNYDLYKVGGILVSIFLIAIASTGSAMVFSSQFNSVIYSLTGTQKLPPVTSTIVKNSVPISADIILQQADKALPEGKTIYITFPDEPKGVFTVRKKLAGDIHPNGSSNVYLDQSSGEVLRVENERKMSLSDRIIKSLFPWHIGAFGDLLTRILYVLIGLFPVISFVTGFRIIRHH